VNGPATASRRGSRQASVGMREVSLSAASGHPSGSIESSLSRPQSGEGGAHRVSDGRVRWCGNTRRCAVCRSRVPPHPPLAHGRGSPSSPPLRLGVDGLCLRDFNHTPLIPFFGRTVLQITANVVRCISALCLTGVVLSGAMQTRVVPHDQRSPSRRHATAELRLVVALREFVEHASPVSLGPRRCSRGRGRRYNRPARALMRICPCANSRCLTVVRVSAISPGSSFSALSAPWISSNHSGRSPVLCRSSAGLLHLSLHVPLPAASPGTAYPRRLFPPDSGFVPDRGSCNGSCSSLGLRFTGSSTATVNALER